MSLVLPAVYSATWKKVFLLRHCGQTLGYVNDNLSYPSSIPIQEQNLAQHVNMSELGYGYRKTLLLCYRSFLVFRVEKKGRSNSWRSMGEWISWCNSKNQMYQFLWQKAVQRKFLKAITKSL